MGAYEHTPGTWHPVLGGTAAGATGAIVAALVSLPLRSPDEIVANSLSIAVASVVVGAVSGALWRRLRASNNGRRLFGWSVAAGWVVAMMAITLVDRTLLDNTFAWATPLAVIVFLSIWALTPLYSGVVGRQWIGVVLVGLALAVGVGLLGRGNVASGELTLDDVTQTSATSTTTTAPAGSGESSTTQSTPTTVISGSVSIVDDLEESYSLDSGIATYSVKEQLQGLDSVGVGRTEAIAGGFVPGGAFEFTIDLQSFESDQSRRDSRVRGWFEDFPTGTFAGSDFELPTSAVVGEAVTFEVEGILTINDISMPAVWRIEARLEPGGSITVTGEVDIVLSDFDIPVLSGGLVTMEDGARIEVAFSASPVG